MPAQAAENVINTRVNFDQSYKDKFDWISERFQIKKVAKIMRFVVDYCYRQEHENEELKAAVERLTEENKALKENLNLYFHSKQNLEKLINQ